MKKLTLNKETVRNLDLGSLKNVQGGAKPPTAGKVCVETASCESCQGAICFSGQACHPESDAC